MTPNKERAVFVYQERRRKTEVDVLKRIIEEKDARIRELEAEIKLLMKMIKNKL